MKYQDVKVSVIVPIYNVEPFVAKCIKSIRKQSHKNIEIILVDDGTPDKSGIICDKFAKEDKRIKVIHQNNSGVSVARNAGLSIASGEYVCFVDGDDYVMPDYISYMLKLLWKYNADISITTQMFGNFNEKQTVNDEVLQWSAEEAIEAILCYRVPIGCYCKLFRRELLNDVRFIPDIFIGEGFNFNVAAFQKAEKVIAGRRKIYYYRRDNSQSAMTKFNINKCRCGLNALNVIKNNLTIRTPRIMKAWEFANWRTHSDFYDMFELAHAQKKYPKEYRQFKTITKKYAFTALHVKTTRSNKIRAIIMKFAPKLIPFAMYLRKKFFKVNIDN